MEMPDQRAQKGFDYPITEYINPQKATLDIRT